MAQPKETFHFEFVTHHAPAKPQSKTASKQIAMLGDVCLSQCCNTFCSVAEVRVVTSTSNPFWSI